MRRFGEDNKTERKQTIIEKISKFFEKYFGISNSENESENYKYKSDMESEEYYKVAEDNEIYNNKK